MLFVSLCVSVCIIYRGIYIYISTSRQHLTPEINRGHHLYMMIISCKFHNVYYFLRFLKIANY
jgi:hypothetical protein